jgi:U4/U6.U5 tri-snRNP-associated protein 3
LEQERRARMARLRAENEDEERRLAALDNKTNSSDSYHHHHDPKSEIIQVDASELEGLSEEEQMQRLLGFGDFTSTKGQAVEDNQTSAARGAATKNKARKYRQYMNRKGGFNRPLEKMD